MPRVKYFCNPVNITYKELKNKNKELREKTEDIGRVLYVNCKENYCVLKYSSERKIIEIDTAIMHIYNEVFNPVSNPSMFRIWHGFKVD